MVSSYSVQCRKSHTMFPNPMVIYSVHVHWLPGHHILLYGNYEHAFYCEGNETTFWNWQQMKFWGVSSSYVMLNAKFTIRHYFSGGSILGWTGLSKNRDTHRLVILTPMNMEVVLCGNSFSKLSQAILKTTYLYSCIFDPPKLMSRCDRQFLDPLF